MSRCLALIFLAACGGDHASAPSSGPDASTGGAATDAGSAPSHGTVHLTMLLANGAPPPMPSTALFFDPDGTLVKKVTTDKDGKADADVATGASVVGISLDSLDGFRYSLQTVLDTRPGDDIALTVPAVDGSSASFTLNFPRLASADTYQVSSPCGAVTVQAASFPSAQLPLAASCTPPTPAELVITAYAGGKAIASIDTPNVPFALNGTYTETGAWGGVQTLTGTFTNLSATVASLAMARVVPDGVGITDGVVVTPITASPTIAVTGGASSTAQIVTTATAATPTTFQTVRESIAGDASTYSLDVGAALLPWLGTMSYDFDTHVITVPVTPAGTNKDAPDLFAASFYYARITADNHNPSFTWTFYAPTIRDVTLPALPGNTAQPTDLAWMLPLPTDIARTLSALALDASKVPGYDSVRNAPGAALTSFAHARPSDPKVRVTRSGAFL